MIMNKEEIFKKGTEYANNLWDVLENPNEHDNAREDFINGALEVVKNCFIPDVSFSLRDKFAMMETEEILRRFENQTGSLKDTNDVSEYGCNMLEGLIVEIRNNLVQKSSDIHNVSTSEIEKYAVFCIELDRQGMNPVTYPDYLKIG